MEGKNIKVYGTLINQTLNTDSSMRDSLHNDLIAVAYQLYDERFTPKKGSGTNGVVINIDKYQDIINKRLTALSYDPNGDLTSLYSNLYVSGDTNIGGNIHVDGTSTFDGPAIFNDNVNITGNVNMNIGLNDLNDVVLSTMAVGQVLRYDGNKWVNSKLSLNDILMPNASAGQVLKFNGTNWVPDEDQSGSGGASNLSDLNDVSAQNPLDGQMLVYNLSTNKWESKSVVGGSIGFVENVVYNMQFAGVSANPSSGGEFSYWYCTVSLDDIKRILHKDVIIKYDNHHDDIVLDGGAYSLDATEVGGGSYSSLTIPGNSMSYGIPNTTNPNYSNVTSVQLILKLYKSGN